MFPHLIHHQVKRNVERITAHRFYRHTTLKQPQHYSQQRRPFHHTTTQRFENQNDYRWDQRNARDKREMDAIEWKEQFEELKKKYPSLDPPKETLKELKALREKIAQEQNTVIYLGDGGKDVKDSKLDGLIGRRLSSEKLREIKRKAAARKKQQAQELSKVDKQIEAIRHEIREEAEKRVDQTGNPYNTLQSNPETAVGDNYVQPNFRRKFYIDPVPTKAEYARLMNDDRRKKAFAVEAEVRADMNRMLNNIKQVDTERYHHLKLDELDFTQKLSSPQNTNQMPFRNLSQGNVLISQEEQQQTLNRIINETENKLREVEKRTMTKLFSTDDGKSDHSAHKKLLPLDKLLNKYAKVQQKHHPKPPTAGEDLDVLQHMSKSHRKDIMRYMKTMYDPPIDGKVNPLREAIKTPREGRRPPSRFDTQKTALPL